MSANDDDIIGKPFFALGPHRIRTKGEEPLDLDTHPVAYFEAVWGEEVYGSEIRKICGVAVMGWN